MNSYTISFIGKTKAGKSTLHAVITGEGDDFIGRGCRGQRGSTVSIPGKGSG